MNDPSEDAAAASTFPGGGDTGELIRTTAWSKTPLCALQAWPPALKAIVRVMLYARQPMSLVWGPRLTQLYNDGFVPILGEKHPHGMGMPAAQLWCEAWPIIGPQFQHVMTTGQSILDSELSVPLLRNGRVQDAWFNYSYSPVFDDAGAIRGVLVVATETTADVATRKQLQAALRERDVLERSRDVLHARERQLREDAEAANRAKDEFLATVSHELRTPLTAILGWARLLKGNSEPQRAQKGLEVIERNAAAQAKLIEDILDVSRIISGKLVLNVRRVDLGNAVRNAVESVRPAANAKQVRLAVKLDEGSAPFVADEDRLQQIVWNLLSNAVKFTPKGGEVSIAASRRGSGITIRVADTGSGISPEFLPHVFERFRQDDASTTRQHAGLGLGLAIVRHLVELHGGTIRAFSEGPGRGAMFEVVLPIRAVDPSARGANERGQNDLQHAPELRRLNGVRALVVDDEEDARDLVATVLSDAGASVMLASSAEEALQIASAADVSVIVSDIGMPTEDGYRFLERLRAEAHSDRERQVPVLALTAYARAEDRDHALRAGFQDHMAKPIDPARLVDAVVGMARMRAIASRAPLGR